MAINAFGQDARRISRAWLADRVAQEAQNPETKVEAQRRLDKDATALYAKRRQIERIQEQRELARQIDGELFE